MHPQRPKKDKKLMKIIRVLKYDREAKPGWKLKQNLLLYMKTIVIPNNA